MKYRKLLHRGIVSTAILLFSVIMHAYTVEWAIPPSYDKYALKRTGRHGLYIRECRSNGENGTTYHQVVDVYGRPIYDNGGYSMQIRAFGERGYSAIIEPGNNYGNIIVGLLLEQEKRFVKFPDGIYEKTPYITEGTICVQDSRGKVGYLRTDGTILVECQFREGYPFREGYALVRNDKDEWMYISKDWDRTHTPLKVDGGQILEGNSFLHGQTFIKSKKKGWIMIGLDGKAQKLPNSKSLPDTRAYRENAIYALERGGEDAKYNNFNKEDAFEREGIYPVYEDSLVGYAFNGKPVVPVQFLNQEVEDFDQGYAVVMTWQEKQFGITVPVRCQGLLRKLDGDFQAVSTDSLITVGVDSTITAFTGHFKVPATLDKRKLHVLLDAEWQDSLIMADNLRFDGDDAFFTWQPRPEQVRNLNNSWITYQVYADYGLLLWEQDVPVNFVSTQKATIGDFLVDPATPDQMQTVWVNINNPAMAKPLKASFSITHGNEQVCSISDSIPANGNVRLHYRVPAGNETLVTARVELSNGQSSQQILQITPYKPQPTQEMTPAPAPTPSTAPKRVKRHKVKKKPDVMRSYKREVDLSL